MKINFSSDKQVQVGSLAKPFHCTRCSKSFAAAKTLEEHILNKHVEDKEFQCKECLHDKNLTKSFATQHILNKHRKRVHGPRLKCQVCLKTFSNSPNLALHIKRTHSQHQPDIKRHTCGICSKEFEFNCKLQTHLFDAHKQKQEDVTYFQCQFCSQEFSARCNLEKHVICRHVADKSFGCSVCSNKFIDQETLEKHMKRHDRKIAYFCDVCSKGFIQKYNLNQHLGVQHNRFFYCEKCLRSFKNKPDFDEHILHSTTELKCYICQQLFSSECNLILHTNSHAKEIKTESEIEPEQSGESLNEETRTKIECELCLKTFDREAYFAAHRRAIHPNAEWKCNVEQCSKTFLTYNFFRLHKMEHAISNEFVCNTCGKSFYRPDNLRKHEQIHLKEKKYGCKICPKSFIAPSGLRVHLANNHGGPKPFECPVVNCETSWASNGQLKLHLISHKTEKSFKCELCTTFKAFKSAMHLKHHERSVHAKTIQARPAGNSKYSDAVVFICSSNTCSFETVSEAEVALHYNRQHQLPQVSIFRNNSSSSRMPLVSEKRECSSEMGKMIEIRFKCQICSKLFQHACKLTRHLEIHSSENPVKCSFCSKTFHLERYLKQHVALQHCKNQKKC